MKIKIKVSRQSNADFFHCQIGDIVEYDFEEYVVSVVSSEIGNAPLEACKAMAVAARTFACSRGVLRGKAIGDTASTAQAFRAERRYKNAIEGTKATAGLVLAYGGTFARTVYCEGNGGSTVSAKTKWGTDILYLVAQEDKWDTGARRGHGVGLSQRGIVKAAGQGFKFEIMLSFYYPGCTLENEIEIGREDLIEKVKNEIMEVQKELTSGVDSSC